MHPKRGHLGFVPITPLVIPACLQPVNVYAASPPPADHTAAAPLAVHTAGSRREAQQVLCPQCRRPGCSPHAVLDTRSPTTPATRVVAT